MQSTLAKLSLCRTSALGGRRYRCAACDSECRLHNSCGDRHCPQCSGAKRADWLSKTAELLLPGVDYFQVVFTIPETLSALALGNRREIFNLLFRSAWRSLKQVIKDEQQFEAAAAMVLHTWNQKLDAHVHVHALVPGGGPSLSAEGRWIRSRRRSPKPGDARRPWLVDADTLRTEFRRVFLQGLKRLHRRGELRLRDDWSHLQDEAAFAAWLKPLEQIAWVTYIEPPPCETSSPQHVLKYLARYLTGGPISDGRLIAHEDGTITFSARSGRTRGGDPADVEAVTLKGAKFVRRWCLHILPKGFVKTRRFGGYSNHHCQRYLAECHSLLPAAGDTSSDVTSDGTASEGTPLTCAESNDVSTDGTGRVCPACGRPLLLLSQGDRPGWAAVMASPHRPVWYDDG